MATPRIQIFPNSIFLAIMAIIVVPSQIRADSQTNNIISTSISPAYIDP